MPPVYQLALGLAFAAFGLAAPAGADDPLQAGLEIRDTERDGDWLRVSYHFQNVGERRIGIGSVRCLARDGDGQVLATASDRIVNADVPYGTQWGVILLKVGAGDPRPECGVEISFWLVDGSFIEAGLIADNRDPTP